MWSDWGKVKAGVTEQVTWNYFRGPSGFAKEPIKLFQKENIITEMILETAQGINWWIGSEEITQIPTQKDKKMWNMKGN